jgi:SlyX protein|tara:strand:+ start:788 stop:994 length:207 start_codon:yes stop_codon:yes gene_type:complete
MEKRITELEIKVAYQEDTIQQLDTVLCQQQNQIDALKKQLQQLTDSTKNDSEDSKDGPSLLDEVPPHY